jgi:hypothetical protein
VLTVNVEEEEEGGRVYEMDMRAMDVSDEITTDRGEWKRKSKKK